MTPDAPDPARQAERQQEANRETAITQTQLNAQDQITPTGSLTYQQLGEWPDGTPRFQATTELTPEQQGLLDQQQKFGGLVNQLGISQADRLQGHLDQPIDMSNTAVEDAIMDRYMPRFEQREDEQRGDLETMLINKGLRPGTEAYNREVQNFRQAQGDKHNQLMLQARGQTIDEMLTGRNQPINEITALMSGGQVSQPQFVSTPQTGIADTDVAGIYDRAHRQDAARQGALISGISNLGSAALQGGWMLSDKRAKQDAKKVGKLDDGTKVYAYRYKGHPMMQLGVMAQEAEKDHPDAVAETPEGVKAVNYERLAEDVTG